MSDILIQLGLLALARDDQYKGEWYKVPEKPGDNAGPGAWAEYGLILAETSRKDKARADSVSQLADFVRKNRDAIERAVQ